MTVNIQRELGSHTNAEKKMAFTQPFFVIGIDASGTIKRVSDDTRHLIGWDNIELINRPIQSLIVEAERNYFAKQFQDSIKHNRNCTMAITFIDKHANSATYSCNLVNLNGHVDNEVIIYALPLNQPNSATAQEAYKKATHEDYASLSTTLGLLSQVANISITGVTICDSEKRVLWANTAFEKITGYRLDEIKNRSLGRLLQGKSTDKNVINTIRTSLDNGRDVDVEILNYSKSGVEYWCHLLISPVFEQQNVTYFVGIQHDITLQKRQHEILSKRSRMHAVAQLAGKICHDINNIMAIISGNVQLLSMQTTNTQIAKYIENIEVATERASAVTQDLLRTVKSEQQDKQLVDINQVINDVVAFLNNRYTASLSFNNDLQCSDKVAINKSLFFEAILSLLLRAGSGSDDTDYLSIETRSVDIFTPGSGTIIYHPKSHFRYALMRIQDPRIDIESSKIKDYFAPANIALVDKSDRFAFSLIDDFCIHTNSGLEVLSGDDKGTTICLWIPINNVNH